MKERKIEVTVGAREARRIQAALAEDVPVQIVIGGGVPEDSCCFPAAFCKGSRPGHPASVRRANPAGLLEKRVLEAAVAEYLDAADFTDSTNSPWSKRAREIATRDVRQFFAQNEADCLAFGEALYPGASTYDVAKLCATDFWLTRNRHGAGFWDRGAGDVGKRLTQAAHGFGEQDVVDTGKTTHLV